MKVYGFILVLYLSSYFSVCANKDEEVSVSCVYQKSCVLPCHFTPGSDPDIQWTKTEGGLTVHSFHHGQNQELKQYPLYSRRTSLFEKKINRGNASLLLRQVTVKDQGRYLCWANRQVTFVNMKVFALVSEVHLFWMDGELICKADNIYPKPEVKWTMNPKPLQEPKTFIESSETELFSVNSSVALSHNSQYQYSCNISTAYNWQSMTYEGGEKNSDSSWFIWMVFGFLLVLSTVLISLVQLKRKAIQAHVRDIYSKFEERWQKNTNASDEPSADGGTAEDSIPEEEHLEPDSSNSDRD